MAKNVERIKHSWTHCILYHRHHAVYRVPIEQAVPTVDN